MPASWYSTERPGERRYIEAENLTPALLGLREEGVTVTALGAVGEPARDWPGDGCALSPNELCCPAVGRVHRRGGIIVNAAKATDRPTRDGPGSPSRIRRHRPPSSGPVRAA